MFRPYDCLTRSLRSSPITGPSSLLRIGPPQCSASVLSPHGFRRLCFSLIIRALVPAVPRKSLHPTHAPSTPVTVCPVIRHLTDLSQKGYTPLVLVTPDFLTTRHRWVYFRSSFGRTPARGRAPSFCSNAHHLGHWTKAAWSGLRPAPESRSRGARPHLSHSFTTPVLPYATLLSLCLCGTLHPNEVYRNPASWPRCAPLTAHVLSLCETDMADNVANARCADLLDKAGSYCHSCGAYSSASPLFERALAIREKMFGPEHPGTAASLNNIAIGESRTPAYGSSAMTVDTRKALAAALTIAEGLSRPSPTISPASRSSKRPRGNVMPLRSRSPTS